MTPIPPIPEDLRELKRWVATLFDQVTYSDSYGVEGSTFHVCRWCGGGSGPGGRPGFKHGIGCLFDNDALEAKVAGAWEEVPELEAEIKQLSERIAKLTAEVERLTEDKVHLALELGALKTKHITEKEAEVGDGSERNFRLDAK